MADKIKKEEFDKIPVYYCKQCLSLAIMNTEEDGIDYCNNCYSADIGITDIYNWKELYKQKYNNLEKEK